MSKASKLPIFILIGLIVVAVGFAGYTLMGKQEVEQENAVLGAELSKSQKNAKKQSAEVNKLNSKVTLLNSEKLKLSLQVKNLQDKSVLLRKQVEDVNNEADKWKKRVGDVRKERDALMAKVKELTAKHDELQERLKERVAVPSRVNDSTDVAEVEDVEASADDSEEASAVVSPVSGTNNDEYWASVLKEKASLEIQIKKLKSKLSDNTLEIVEVKQSNADLKIELDNLKHDKTEIAREIKYKEDLINNLSLELARTKNDKKFVADRVETLSAENKDIRGDIKKLMSTKAALEKTIVRITKEKNEIEQDLGKTESIIQSKIDEIWEIKESLDRSFKASQVPQSKTEIELPPIVVSSDGPSISFDPGSSAPGFNGTVVSINEENNFIIVDIGEASGLRIGDMLSVYRDAKYIARLEVIQVRKDISAADIKDQWSKIQVGDIIR